MCFFYLELNIKDSDLRTHMNQKSSKYIHSGTNRKLLVNLCYDFGPLISNGKTTTDTPRKNNFIDEFELIEKLYSGHKLITFAIRSK